MNKVRIIPRLDIKGPNLVKGIHLEGLRVLGTPADFAKFYYENGADEIVFMDVVASLYERNGLHDIIRSSSEDIFMPLTVGGGIRTLHDIKSVLRSGADKVCLNTAAIKNPDFVKSACETFGSSTIVVAIEAIKQNNGNYLAFVDNGREHTGLDVVEWAHKVQDLGAGELIITSVDNEGTGMGFDSDLIKMISRFSTIPLLVHGGAGTKDHVLEVLNIPNVDGVCIASLFHYDFIKSNNFDFISEEGNFDFLKSNRNNKRITSLSINDLKLFLLENNVNVRLPKF